MGARKAEQEQRQREDAIKARADVAFLTKILDATTKTGRAEQEFAVAELYRHIDCDLELLELIEKRFKLKRWARPEDVLKAARKMSDRELAQLITAEIVANGLDVWDKTGVADDIAALRKVGRKAIEKQVREEIKPKVYTSAKSKSAPKSKARKKK